MHALIMRGIAIISLFLLAAGAILPWYAVPFEIREDSAGGVECWCPTTLTSRIFGTACLAVAGAVGWGSYRGRPGVEWRVKILPVFLAGLLLFPYCITILDPAAAAQSTWLYEQHENLAAFNGDYSVDQELGSFSWRRYVYANPEDVWRVPVFQPPVWGPELFQLGNLQVLTRALGYKESFCQFFGVGWVAAVVGTLGLLWAACTEGGVTVPGRVQTSACLGLAACAVCTLAALLPVVMVAAALGAAQEATALGEYQTAASYLDDATAIFPPLHEDFAFTMQRCLLDWRLGREDSHEAQLYRAELYERQGQESVAEQGYREIVTSVERGTAVHHEACRGLLRIGIVALNAGRLNRATELIESVLAHEPCNLKANFALQLAYLRTSRRPDLERLVKRIERIYARYQYPTKMLMVSFSHDNARFAAFLAGDLKDAMIHDFRAKHPEVSSKSYRVKHP